MSGTPPGLLVVGSGPAALEAVRAFRTAGSDHPVTLVSDDVHPPYGRPPLSKEFLRGEVPAEDLALEDASFFDDLDVRVLLGRRVTGLDSGGGRARLVDDTEIGFTTCVLATGVAPVRPDVVGMTHPDVLLLRSRASAETLRLRAASSSTAVVVGSGFIGCEAAASLAMRGLEVTIVTGEAQPQAARLGPDAASRVAGWLQDLGVRLVTDRTVEAVAEGRVLTLGDGSRHEADLLLVAAGVTPRSELAAGARLADGRVVVDEHMRTTQPGLLAAGDVVLAHNAAAGRRVAVEHWGEAVRMGEVAGRTAAGVDDSWAQVPGFWSQIGDRTLKYAGWGDGWDEATRSSAGSDGFTVWYRRDGRTVGVLTHGADEDYERGRRLIESSGPA